jgi:LPPG:FO 2-phospho-L-lactate transferase
MQSDRPRKTSFSDMKMPRFLAITGGVGGAKLSLGLVKLLGADELAFVVNTGDDFSHLGFHISPDIDTLVYTLAGISNTETGWGRSDESWQFMQALTEIGGETWFALGDKDMAMHVERRRLLNAGSTIAEVTASLAESFGVVHRILPMTNDPVHTRVLTAGGPMDFQHYFVRDKCEPRVSGFEFEGSEQAVLNPEVADWLESDALCGIIICPSNPFVSVDPILALPGLREQLRDCPAPVIAVSPVVGGKALKGPTVKMMRELGLPNTADSVAEHYADFLDGFVLDCKDRERVARVEALGLACTVTQTVMKTLGDRVNLGRTCLEFIEQLTTGQPSSR